MITHHYHTILRRRDGNNFGKIQQRSYWILQPIMRRSWEFFIILTGDERERQTQDKMMVIDVYCHNIICERIFEDNKGKFGRS